MYIPLFSLVQLGYPAITSIFVVNQIIRYNGVFAITNIFFDTVTLRYSGVPLYQLKLQCTNAQLKTNDLQKLSYSFTSNVTETDEGEPSMLFLVFLSVFFNRVSFLGLEP